MSGITKTKNGLVEKNSNRKIDSPVDVDITINLDSLVKSDKKFRTNGDKLQLIIPAEAVISIPYKFSLKPSENKTGFIIVLEKVD